MWLLKSFKVDDADRLLADKENQLAEIKEQLARLEADKKEQMAKLEAQLARLETEKKEQLEDKKEQLAKLEAEKKEQMAKLEAEKKEQMAKLEAEKKEQLADKKEQLAEIKEQLARLEADKKEQMAKLEADKKEQLALKSEIIRHREVEIGVLKAQILKTQAMHAALTSMRPVMEVYIRILYDGKVTTSLGLKRITNECFNYIEGKPVLKEDAIMKLKKLEGRVPTGTIEAMEKLMDTLSAPHHNTRQMNGFICGGDLPARAAAGLALATAQEMLAKNPDKFANANFQIDYCNDAWEVTSSFNDGNIRRVHAMDDRQEKPNE